MGRLQGPVRSRLWDQMMGRSKDVYGTSVKHVFKTNSQIHSSYFDSLLKTL